MSRNAKRIRTVLAFPADEHAGSLYGLIRPHQWQLKSGNFKPNGTQKLIWKQWVECWEWVKDLRKGSRLIIINNGDAVEGFHHNTDEVISIRPDEHERIFVDAFDEGMKIAGFGKGDLLYFMQGSTTHVGKSEERIARDLGAVPFRPGTEQHNYHDGYYPWSHLHLNVNGILMDVAHKGTNPGRRKWTEGNGLLATAKDIYYRCLDFGADIPRYVIGAHWHKWVPPQLFRGEQGTVEVVSLPCFKAKDDYAHEVARDQFTHIGLFAVVVEPDGATSWDCKRITITKEIEYV